MTSYYTIEKVKDGYGSDTVDFRISRTGDTGKEGGFYFYLEDGTATQFDKDGQRNPDYLGYTGGLYPIRLLPGQTETTLSIGVPGPISPAEDGEYFYAIIKENPDFKDSQFTTSKAIGYSYLEKAKEPIKTPEQGEAQKQDVNVYQDDIIGSTTGDNRSSGTESAATSPSNVEAGRSFSFGTGVAFGKKVCDIITDFNPGKEDRITIDTSAFGNSGTKLRVAKKNKPAKFLSKKKIDFIFDESKGYLYYNENGDKKGFGDGGVFAIFRGLSNFERDSIFFE